MTNWKPLNPADYVDLDNFQENKEDDVNQEIDDGNEDENQVIDNNNNENENQEIDDDNNDEDGDDQNEKEGDTDNSSTTEAEQDTEDEDDDDERKKRNSRAQERIRQLVKERNEYREKYEQAVDESKQARKLANESAIEKNEQAKILLTNSIESLENQLKNAYNEGDHDKVVKLTSDLQKTRINLTIAENWQAPEQEEIDDDDVKKPKNTTSQKPKLEDAPEVVQDWILDNNWFVNPQTQEDINRIRAAATLSDLMVKMGKDPTTPEFYKELDKRLNGTFAKDSENKVKSNSRSSETDFDVKQQKKKVQTVQGASRTSKGSGDSSASKKYHGLTKEERDMADQLGLDYKTYKASLDQYKEINKDPSTTKRMVPLY